MADSVDRVYHDPEIRDLVSTCAEIFGIGENHVFPLKNYSKEVQVRLDVDILALYTLKRLVGLAEETLENQKKMANLKAKPLQKTSWREGLEKLDKPELDELKKYLVEFDINEDSEEEEGDRMVLILLLGLHNAGKSSYINTLQSAFFNHITNKATVMPGEHAVITKELRKYQIQESRGRKGKKLNFTLLDTMGLHSEAGIHAKDVERLLDGSVPEKHVFNPSVPLPVDVQLETKENQPHVMALVVDGSTIKDISSDMKKELKDMIKYANSKDIATVVLVTHIDQVCPHVEDDIEKVYFSIALREVVAYVSKELGVIESSVFPVQNYVSEHQPRNAMDILALRALKEMLTAAEDNIFG